MVDTKNRGDLSPEKVQVNWRLCTKILTALRHEADQQGFSTIPLYFNHLLTLHYFGNKKFAWNGEWIGGVDGRFLGASVEKKIVNWRILKRVVNALQADADQWGITVANLLNSMLMFHYFRIVDYKGDRES